MVYLKALVTGASGFVGKHLMKKINSLNIEALGVSRTNSYINMQEDSNYLCDILDKETLKQILQNYNPDIIFHLAAPAYIPNSLKNPHQTYDLLFNGTLNLLESVEELDLDCKILYVSSADVYGLNSKTILSENDQYNPINPYALGKSCAELLCKQYSYSKNMNIVIARPFNHTGPGQSKDFVCSNFAYQIASIIKRQEDKHILEVGNIDVKRDFLDVRDVVDAYINLLKYGLPGEIYNVCSSEGISIRQIIHWLFEAGNIEDFEIVISDNRVRKNDVSIRVGDNRRLTESIGWQQKYQLKQTLFDLLNYWRERI